MRALEKGCFGGRLQGAAAIAVPLLAVLLLAVLRPGSEARAAIVGEAVAQATYKGQAVVSKPVRQSVDVAPGVAALSLVSGPVSRRQVLPGLFEIGHWVRARNTGTLTLTDVQIGEDLNAALSSGRILAGPWLETDGFGGGGVNPSFDGRSDRLMLGGGARLAPGAEAGIEMRLHAAARRDAFAFMPRPRALARQLAEPVIAEARSEAIGTAPSILGIPGEGRRAGMALVFGPVAEQDGWSLVTYRLAAEAGKKGIEGVSIRNDLVAGFGAGNFRIVSLDQVAAPERFGASPNPFFDGAGDSDILTSGGDLAADEAVAVDLTLRVRSGGERRTSTMTVGRAMAVEPIATASLETAFPAAKDQPPATVAISANRDAFGSGERLGYSLMIGGDLPDESGTGDVVVRIAEGFSYLPGTGNIDGAMRDPAVDANLLVWSDVALAGEGRRIEFDLVTDPALTGRAYAVTGYVRDPASGAMLSAAAQATVRRDEEAVFDCTGIRGEVFDDSNRDGFRQSGEPGIGGVRVGLRQGPLVTSRRDGSFDLSCAILGRQRIGTAASLELVLATLPSGYHPTTVTTQAVSLRRGRVAHAGFGAAQLPVIALQLDAASFAQDGTQLEGKALQALARVINRLEQAPSILRIVYAQSDDSDLAARRIGAVRALAERAWRADSRPHELVIETRLE